MKFFRFYRAIILSVLLVVFQVFSYAQDTTSTRQKLTEVLTDDEAQWYMQPWVWVVGGIALLLLLIALFSGGRKKEKAKTRTDKVIITKTVRTETDVDD